MTLTFHDLTFRFNFYQVSRGQSIHQICFYRLSPTVMHMHSSCQTGLLGYMRRISDPVCLFHALCEKIVKWKTKFFKVNVLC